MSATVRSRLSLALALGLLATGAAVVAAGDGAEEKIVVKLALKTDHGTEKVEIQDLGDLAVGASRSFTTESGKSVIVTRDEKGFELDLDGKTIRIGDGDALHAHGDAIHRKHRVKKIEVGEDGARKIVVSDDPHVQRVIVRKGSAGEDAYAFSTGDGEPHVFLAGPGLMERIETHAKFLALDDTTREIVREIVREAARPMEWIERHGDGGERVEIFVERKHEVDDDE